jgi:pre-mRNA-splicing factor SYF1
LERQARAPVGFVAASTGPEGGNRKELQPQPGPVVNADANPDALDVDLDDDDE